MLASEIEVMEVMDMDTEDRIKSSKMSYKFLILPFAFLNKMNIVSITTHVGIIRYYKRAKN